MSDRFEELEEFYEDLSPNGRWLIDEVRRLRTNEKAFIYEQRRLNARLNEAWDRLRAVAKPTGTDLFEIIDSVTTELTQLRAHAAPPLSDSDRVSQIIEGVHGRVYDKQACIDINWLVQEIGSLRALVKDVNRRLCQVVGVSQNFTENTRELVTSAVRHIQGNRSELGKAHDILAEALGYQKAPTAEEDPDCPCPGDYITGEHTTETLAVEAANRIAELKHRVSTLKMNYKEARATVKRLLRVSDDD